MIFPRMTALSGPRGLNANCAGGRPREAKMGEDQKTGVSVKLIFYFHQRVGEWPGPVGEFAEAGPVVCTQLWVLDVFGAVG